VSLVVLVVFTYQEMHTNGLLVFAYQAGIAQNILTIHLPFNISTNKKKSYLGFFLS